MKKSTPYILLIPQLLLMVVFIFGIIAGITQSFGVIPVLGLKEPTLEYYKRILTNPGTLQSIGISFRIALISAVIATVLGLIITIILVSWKKSQGGLIRVVQLPIVVPHVVVALMMIILISQNGLFSRLLFACGIITDQQQFPLLIYDAKGIGVILAYLWKETPFIVYSVMTLMANINGSYGEAAINLGAGRWQVLRRVTLPLCRNTIMSSFLIIFVFTLGAYELPLLLGASSPRTLPILAYFEFTKPNLLNRPYAMAINGVVILVSMLSALLYFVLIKRSYNRFLGNMKGGE